VSLHAPGKWGNGAIDAQGRTQERNVPVEKKKKNKTNITDKFFREDAHPVSIDGSDHFIWAHRWIKLSKDSQHHPDWDEELYYLLKIINLR
jgi:hypothetical protein